MIAINILVTLRFLESPLKSHLITLLYQVVHRIRYLVLFFVNDNTTKNRT